VTPAADGSQFFAVIISEFPHKAHYDGALIEQNFVPSPDLWILEIQLRHPTRPFGAFYEDLLTDG
jgi:hypothetical protein